MTHCRDATKPSYLSPPTISDEPLFDPPLKKKTKMMKKTVACSEDPLAADAEPIVHEPSTLCSRTREFRHHCAGPSHPKHIRWSRSRLFRPQKEEEIQESNPRYGGPRGAGDGAVPCRCARYTGIPEVRSSTLWDDLYLLRKILLTHGVIWTDAPQYIQSLLESLLLTIRRLQLDGLIAWRMVNWYFNRQLAS